MTVVPLYSLHLDVETQMPLALYSESTLPVQRPFSAARAEPEKRAKIRKRIVIRVIDVNVVGKYALGFPAFRSTME